MLDQLWRFFISLRLTFVLLVILSLGALLGMSYDQTLSFDEFLSKTPQSGFVAQLANFFELYDAFHSWWFSLVIVLLSANLIACSLERLPRIYYDAKRPRPYLTDRRLLGLSMKKEVQVTDKIQAYEIIKNFFGKAFAKAQLNNSEYYYCERQTAGRFGVYIVHIALLIVMYSAVYATQNGVDGHVMIEEGDKTRFISAKGAGGVNYTYDLGFYIGCDDFRLSTFLDNSPMEFESDLFISQGEDEFLARQTVRVNEPLTHAGFTFYQSSYRPVLSEKIVNLAVADRDGNLERHRVHLNSEIKLSNGISYTPQKLYDDFAGLGEALRVNQRDTQGESTYFHIFRKYPDFDKQVRAAQNHLVFLGSDQKYATGLSIGKVPGVSFIFSGFLLFLIGLYMCFFMTPVRYFARLQANAQGYEVTMGAQGFRHMASVRAEFLKRAGN